MTAKSEQDPTIEDALETLSTSKDREATSPPNDAKTDEAVPLSDAEHVDILQERVRQVEAELRGLQSDSKRLVRNSKREGHIAPFQVELLKLQRHLEVTNTRMIVLFEGRDAAGKGGTIRRITRYMNKKHYRVVALPKPTAEQRSQWYLQRYIAEFPRGGEIVLFDRSWYNRAMVEPVFGFCTQQEYDHFLRGVVGFEKDLVRQGTVLVKLYFSVTKDEQLRRFERRRDDPLRQWKLSEVDVQAQEHWAEFTNYKYEMLRRTHTSATPWTIIRSENKHRARYNAMKVILNAVPYEDRSESLGFVPDPEIVVSGAREIELMESARLKKGKFDH